MISQPDLSKIFEILDQDMRHKLLIYLNDAKRISHRKLGISPSYLYLLKRGKRRITDDLLLKLLEYVTVKEFLLCWWAGWDSNPGPPPRQGEP